MCRFLIVWMMLLVMFGVVECFILVRVWVLFMRMVLVLVLLMLMLMCMIFVFVEVVLFWVVCLDCGGSVVGLVCLVGGGDVDVVYLVEFVCDDVEYY